MILLINFEKGFDSVSLKFIMTFFDIFNFGKNFKQWIKIVLGMDKNSGFQAVNIVNGNISRRINVNRICQRGNPISGYLFILSIKILALLLNNSKIKAYMQMI